MPSRTLPWMMRDMSRRSSTSCACARVLRSMTSSACPCRDASSEPVLSSDTQPKIAFSGVRSSCDTVAMNSSFARLSASALRRADFSRSSSAVR